MSASIPPQKTVVPSLRGSERMHEKGGGRLFTQPASGTATPLLDMAGMLPPQSPRPTHRFGDAVSTQGTGGSIICLAKRSDRTPAPQGCRMLAADRVSRTAQASPQAQLPPTSGAMQAQSALGSFVGGSSRGQQSRNGSFIGASASSSQAGITPQQAPRPQAGPVLAMPCGSSQGMPAALVQSQHSLLQFSSRGQPVHQPLSSPHPDPRNPRAESVERCLAEMRQVPLVLDFSRVGVQAFPLTGSYAMRGEGTHGLGPEVPLTPHLQHLQHLQHLRHASPAPRQSSPARQASPLARQVSVVGAQSSPLGRYARHASPMRSPSTQYFQQATPLASPATRTPSPMREDLNLRGSRRSSGGDTSWEASYITAGMSQQRQCLPVAHQEGTTRPAVELEERALKAGLCMPGSFSAKACCPQGHPLVALGTSRDDGWDCDARGEPGGCLSGITGFNQSAGMVRFRCDLCVYDLCERCFAARSRGVAAQQLKALDLGRTAAKGEAASPDVRRELAASAVEAPPAVPAPRSAATPRRVRALCALPGSVGTGPGSASRPWGWQEASATPAAPATASRSSLLSDLWSADLTYRLEGSPEDIACLAGKVPLLDAELVCSVNQAVDGLNRGTLHCPEDFCIAYSASNQGWYLLHKRGKRDVALSQLGIHEDQQQQQQEQQQQQQLHVGSVVTIGRCQCKVVAALGTGSFGTVWAAERIDATAGEVAIKEIICRTPQERASAAFEGRLLELLHGRVGNPSTGSASIPILDHSMSGGGSSSSSSKAQDRIPDLVGMESENVGADVWRVLLAMTRVPGVPLDRFLDVRSRSAADTNLPSEQQDCFKQACHFARELVLQLAPTFEHVAAFAYHRDVNSHNILIEGDGEKPVFGLVDFGLAADLSRWRGPMGPLSWHLVDIGGDCRYWPMSAWLQFECGWQELSKYPPLSSEYQLQLDFHALGITALQVLSAMSPRAEGDALPPELRALQAAWDQYWEDATRFWQRLLDVFRRGGDQNALKVACISEGVHNIVGANLAALRLALREAYSAASSEGHTDGLLSQARPLFAALLELVSAGGTVGFEEVARPPCWKAVRALVATSSTETPRTARGASPAELLSQRCTASQSRRSGGSRALSAMQ